MGKVKISKKPKISLVKSPKFVTLKAGVKSQKWSPTEELLRQDELAKSLFFALKEEDLNSFKEILKAHLEAKIKSHTAKVHGLAERTMYESLSETGNPSLKTLAKIVKMACAS